MRGSVLHRCLLINGRDARSLLLGRIRTFAESISFFHGQDKVRSQCDPDLLTGALLAGAR